MRWIIAFISVLLFAGSVRAETISISAAISLKESLGDIRKNYETATSDKLVFNLDASGKLATQIQQGAPVDLFISADNDQMDKLEKAGLIETTTRRVIVNNTLVLITSPDEKNPPADFAALKADSAKKIAIGEPKTVPAGRYAVQTLTALHLYDDLKSRLVYGESVRQVLTYVEQDQTAAGIVYGTDAKQAGDKVKIIAIADASTHEKIEYPAAVITNSAHSAAAKRFLDYLATEPAKKVLIDRGLAIPGVEKSEIRNQKSE